MPRLETYVPDRVYVRILQYKAEHHINSNGKAACEILQLYFQLIKSQDQAVNRLNKVIQDQAKQIKELNNQVKHEKMKQGLK